MNDLASFELLTFDCYGTLIDWETGILDVVRPILARHGVTADDERILELYAVTEAKQERGEYTRYELILRMIMTELSLRLGFDASPEEILALSASVGGWKPFPDTVRSLRALKSRYKLAVISNVDDRLFADTAAQLEVPFDDIVTAQQAGAYKPDRKVFEYALSKLGVPPEKILHVAQSLYHDIAPARALGLATVWVNRRHGRKGSGATPPATATPDLEVPDLDTLVRKAGL